MNETTRKGTRFEVFKKSGRWNWELHVSNDPAPGCIAISGRDYLTKQGAKKGIEAARRTMRTMRHRVEER